MNQTHATCSHNVIIIPLSLNDTRHFIFFLSLNESIGLEWGRCGFYFGSIAVQLWQIQWMILLLSIIMLIDKCSAVTLLNGLIPTHTHTHFNLDVRNFDELRNPLKLHMPTSFIADYLIQSFGMMLSISRSLAILPFRSNARRTLCDKVN